MEFLNQYIGMFNGDHSLWFILGTVFLVLFFGFRGFPLWAWTILAAVALLGFGAPLWLTGAVVAVALVFIIKPIRRVAVSSIVMKTMKALKLIPQISQTERTALEAGVVWVEQDLFSGQPDFKRIMREESYPDLTEDEQAFIDGPVEELCKMVDDWDIYSKKRIPKKAWDFMKKEKFFGMIVPKEYGGLGFSALAHSAVIQKLNTRSSPVAITVMVPNSLGPAELLNHYGTQKQKDHYLPRLATGEEIPCFGLTEPEAGSDAGSIQSTGELFKGDDGKIYLKLNWNKRWITLAAVSTIMGLAFRLYDPEELLGKGKDLGITCALVPTDTKGVVVGRRHDPLGVPFYNCPTQGHDVVVSIDQVIGGEDGCGKGWKMLMESLGAGRGISLPSQSCGGAKIGTRVVTAHSVIRKQFGLSIGKFEGVEEPIARIGAFTYLLDAMRKFTIGALDKGISPPVVTAMAKYNATEIGRKLVNDAMDVMGGAAISRGPRNTMANHYMTTPIGITVEGANILTRTLMIFGQGALRAHPYAFKEVDAIDNNDLKAFDEAFWGHIGHIGKNKFRSFLLSLSRGRLAAPVGDKHTRRYYRKLSWASASFAIMADIAMGTLGGKLKVREMLTGRFADILSNMYMATSILKRYEAEGRKKEDLPLVHYSLKYCMNNIQEAFDGIFANMNVMGPVGWFFRGPVRVWANVNSHGEDISDELVHKVASLIQKDSSVRDRLTEGIFIPEDREQQVGRLEYAFEIVHQSAPAEKKVRTAMRKKIVPKGKIRHAIDEALKKDVITQAEYDLLKEADRVRVDAIQVDDFSEEEYLGHQPAGVNEDGMSQAMTSKKIS